jgi:hypothetical protein
MTQRYYISRGNASRNGANRRKKTYIFMGFILMNKFDELIDGIDDGGRKGPGAARIGKSERARTLSSRPKRKRI